MNKTLQSYLTAALWSSTDDDCIPLDDNYGIYDISQESIKDQETQLTDFLTANAADIAESGMPLELVAYDFWLTRNGHGAGFWDRGLGAVGDRLTQAAEVYGSVYVYTGDDGMLYFS